MTATIHDREYNTIYIQIFFKKVVIKIFYGDGEIHFDSSAGPSQGSVRGCIRIDRYSLRV